MKAPSCRKSNEGMTLLEIFVVLFVITLVMMMFWPNHITGDKTKLTHCLYNVKQIDLGFILYSQDNHGRSALQTPGANGGTLEFMERNQTFPHYQKISPYLPNPSAIVCPVDKDRHAAASYTNLSDTNLSYFLNADVSIENPVRSILTGHRNLQANGQPVPHGTFIYQTNMNLAWTPGMHHDFGTLGFADGHAESHRSLHLSEIFRQQGLATARLSVP